MVDAAQVQIPARDGVPSTGTAFTSDGASAGVVVVNAAMAVPANFYRRFANRLAKAGLHVVIWDYRDVGASARGPLWQSRATLLD